MKRALTAKATRRESPSAGRVPKSVVAASPPASTAAPQKKRRRAEASQPEAPATAPAATDQSKSIVLEQSTHVAVSSSSAMAKPEAAAPELTPEEYLRTIQRRAKISRMGGGAGEATAGGGAAATSAQYTGVNLKLAASDPIYRIIHQAHRSDVVEIVRCKFGDAECERAASYLGKDFTEGPVRKLRLQVNLALATGLGRLLPFVAHHTATLRLVDLSRNQLTADDVVTLSRALHLTKNNALQVLDLSYNRGIGNAGATVLLSNLAQNAFLKALILKNIALDDDGGCMLAPYVQQRPVPSAPQASDGDGPNHNWTTPWGCDEARGDCNFFLNLNENCIGARGVVALRRCLPEHVSLTIVKQHVMRGDAKPKANRASSALQPS